MASIAPAASRFWAPVTEPPHVEPGVRSDIFRAATARQIGREFAGLDPGPGLDASPVLPCSPLLPLHVDAIDWEMAPAETIPAEGGNLRASTIAFRELAQAGYRLIQSHVDRERLDGYRKHLLLLGRKHKFTICWQRDSGGKAYWGRGYIETPQIDVAGDPTVGEERAALGYHEAAHMIVGGCPDDGVVHRRDQTVTDAWHCIACEVAATQTALSLAPFTRPMFDRLARGLESYRRGTPAAPAQIAKLDALKGTISYAEHRQRWWKWQ